MAEQPLKHLSTQKTIVVVKLSDLFRLFNRHTLTILSGNTQVHSSRLATAGPGYLLLPGYESVDLLLNCAETNYTPIVSGLRVQSVRSPARPPPQLSHNPDL